MGNYFNFNFISMCWRTSAKTFYKSSNHTLQKVHHQVVMTTKGFRTAVSQLALISCSLTHVSEKISESGLTEEKNPVSFLYMMDASSLNPVVEKSIFFIFFCASLLSKISMMLLLNALIWTPTKKNFGRPENKVFQIRCCIIQSW